MRSLIGRVPLYEGTQLTSARTQRRPLYPKRALGFLLERGGGAKWRLPGPMSADVRHMAPTPGPLRSPPALRVPWGHAPPIWRPGGPRRRPHHARFGRWLGRRAWSAAARVVTYGCCATYPRARGGYGRSLRPLGALWVAGGDSGCASLVSRPALWPLPVECPTGVWAGSYTSRLRHARVEVAEDVEGRRGCPQSARA